MKNKNIIKLILDVIMTVLLVLMFNKRVISMSFHEIGGLVLCALFIVHILLNYKWVLTMSKKIFSKDMKLKVRIGYIVNALLLLTMGFIGLSGLFISKTIFTSISSDNVIWKLGHQAAGGFALILMGIHLGLHWPFIKGMFKKIFSLPEKLKKPLGVVVVIVTIVLGIYSMATTSFTRWISMPFTVASMSKNDGIPNKEHNVVGQGDGTQRQSRGERPEGSKGKEYGQGQGISIANIFKVIMNFLTIISTIGIWTVWIERLVIKKKKIN